MVSCTLLLAVVTHAAPQHGVHIAGASILYADIKKRGYESGATPSETHEAA